MTTTGARDGQNAVIASIPEAPSSEVDMGLFRKEGAEPQGRRFQMCEKLFSIGEDYWIEDEDGRQAFKVNGKALRLRDTWSLEDPSGRTVATIREKKLTLRDKITIELDGREAVVKRALIGIGDRFHVEVEHGEDLKVKGDVADHEYEIERDGKEIAEVSKKWFRLRETYGVEVRDELDAVLVLAVTVAVDALSDD